MNSRKIMLILPLFLFSYIATAEGGSQKQPRYSCIIYEGKQQRILYEGELSQKIFDIMFRDGCFGHLDYIEIPKDANQFGIFSASDANINLSVPLYTWIKGKNKWCGCQFNNKFSGVSFARCWPSNEQDFAWAMKYPLIESYKTAPEIPWDPNMLNSKSVSASKQQLNWNSDTLLILKLDKILFGCDEPIHVQVQFVNLSPRCIAIRGILPLGNMASPPGIHIKNSDNEMAEDCNELSNIPKELLTKDAIIIHSKHGIIVYEAELTNTPDYIIAGKPDSYGGRMAKRAGEPLRAWLKPGEYTIYAHYMPAGAAGGMTEELKFQIEKN